MSSEIRCPRTEVSLLYNFETGNLFYVSSLQQGIRNWPSFGTSSLHPRGIVTDCVRDERNVLAERCWTRNDEVDPGLATDTMTDRGPPRSPLPW